MQEVCRAQSERFQHMAQAKDKIGWHRCMEGMVSPKVLIYYGSFLRSVAKAGEMSYWPSGLPVRDYTWAVVVSKCHGA